MSSLRDYNWNQILNWVGEMKKNFHWSQSSSRQIISTRYMLSIVLGRIVYSSYSVHSSSVFVAQVVLARVSGRQFCL